jgi:hypothetical protein
LPTAIHNPDLKRLRAAQFLEYRLANNASREQIAAHFKVSVSTVERVFAYARRAGLIVQAEDKILDELVPAAHNALKAALTDKDNVQMAGQLGLKVMENALPGFGKKPAAGKGGGSGDEDALAKAIEEARSEFGHLIIDADPDPEPQRALPAAQEGAPAEGNDGELREQDAPGASDDSLGASTVGAGVSERADLPASGE